jgi:Ca2+-binding RTX toxin-like protein
MGVRGKLFVVIAAGVAVVAVSVSLAARVHCEAGSLECNGTNRADKIRGSDEHDYIYGKGGDDVIKAGSANDYVDGGGGDDEIYGGLEGDVLFTGGLHGGRGDDRIDGEVGGDTLIGDEGRDKLIGGPGDDALGAAMPGESQGRDVLNCGGGTDEAVADKGDKVKGNCESVGSP